MHSFYISTEHSFQLVFIIRPCCLRTWNFVKLYMYRHVHKACCWNGTQKPRLLPFPCFPLKLAHCLVHGASVHAPGFEMLVVLRKQWQIKLSIHIQTVNEIVRICTNTVCNISQPHVELSAPVVRWCRKVSLTYIFYNWFFGAPMKLN